MKKKIIFALFLVAIIFLAPACEKTCKSCVKIYFDGTGTEYRRDGAADYCGVELIAKDGKTVDLGALGTAKWECN